MAQMALHKEMMRAAHWNQLCWTMRLQKACQRCIPLHREEEEEEEEECIPPREAAAYCSSCSSSGGGGSAILRRRTAGKRKNSAMVMSPLPANKRKRKFKPMEFEPEDDSGQPDDDGEE